jgi:hypothetical protein
MRGIQLAPPRFGHHQQLVRHDQPLRPRRGPLLTRCRNRTVLNGDSTGLVVRKCSQCSAGKSKNVSRFSWSRSRDATAFGYFAWYL